MLIKDIQVKGFWGRAQATASFFPDVTIFIGLNGTGKTTFINLIAAVLTVDIEQLSSIDFNEVNINLKGYKNNKKIQRKITVSNKTNEHFSDFPGSDFPGFIYEYKIGNTKYTLFLPVETQSRRIKDKVSARLFPPSLRREYLSLKREMLKLVEVSQISVYRQVSGDMFEEDYSYQRISAVDKRLQQLFERFSRYQLKLETQLNERSTQFQQEALASLLYNEQFDQLSSERLDEVLQIDLDKQEDRLSSAFSELGIQGKSEEINKHIAKLKEAIQGLKDSNKDYDGIEADNVLALPLIYRTNHIIDLLNQSEQDKREIVGLRNQFYTTLKDFIKNKEFHFDNKSSEFSFSLNNMNERKLPWHNLSSGEKQLLIQFMEVVLQEGRSLIFIADEPELSLHVTWQEKLLKALRSLNKNAQLIVATHSPDIVSEYSKNVIDMEEVITTNVY
jgi:predicted ATPase